MVATSRMPQRFVDRPLNLPEDTFDLRFLGGYAQLRSDVFAADLEAGAGYGVYDELELGLRLLRVTMSPEKDTGLERPTGYIRYRPIDGIFGLAASAEVELPTSGPPGIFGQVDMLLRLFGLLRLDVSGRFSALPGSPWGFVFSMPAELRIQVVDAFSLGIRPIMHIPSLRTPENITGQLGFRAVYTFGAKGKATADLSLMVTTPSMVLAGERPQDPDRNNYFGAVLELSFFLINPAQRESAQTLF